jgi:hypothetical protein
MFLFAEASLLPKDKSLGAHRDSEGASRSGVFTGNPKLSQGLRVS